MIKDDKWPVARLIPISSASGVEAQERRLASALLAVMGAVPEFGYSLLKPLDAPAGKIETFIEVPFKLGDKSVRPDGVITVTRAGKTWRAIVEAKVAASQLEPAQMNAYLDLARELDFEAVISISNQYVTSSTEYPIEIDKRKLRRVTLKHWSWVDLLTEAIVTKEYKGLKDPDQAYILGELIRYLSDARSGAVAFDGMGSGWTAVREGSREQTLRKTDQTVISTVARWDDLVRYLGLSLTTDLGRQVKQILPPTERTPATRRQALIDSLVTSGRLYADLQVPNVAGPLTVVADLRSRQIVTSTLIDAPREGTSKGRVSWLLRQLAAAPDGLKVEARLAYRSAPLSAPLAAVRENPSGIYPDPGKEIRAFALSLSSTMGLKRDAGRGSFVESVLSGAETFYGEVLQKLRAWKAAPPKLKRAAEPDETPQEVVAEIVGVEPERIAPLDDDPEADALSPGSDVT
ncbi:MAG: hypothetical protein WD096_02600 [Actinomycetota bacterium]